MKEVALSDMKDDLSRYLRQAAKEEIVITRHGKAAGVLIGFESEDDWIDYRFENDPRFLNRIAAARASLRAGYGVPLDDLDEAGNPAVGRGSRRRMRGDPTKGVAASQVRRLQATEAMATSRRQCVRDQRFRNCPPGGQFVVVGGVS